MRELVVVGCDGRVSRTDDATTSSPRAWEADGKKSPGARTSKGSPPVYLLSGERGRFGISLSLASPVFCHDGRLSQKSQSGKVGLSRHPALGIGIHSTEYGVHTAGHGVDGGLASMRIVSANSLEPTEGNATCWDGQGAAPMVWPWVSDPGWMCLPTRHGPVSSPM